MDSISFRVYGEPAPKGSVTRMPNRAYLPAGTPASRMKFAIWKDNVSTAAKIAMDGKPPWYGAIRLLCEFQLPVPTSQIRKYQWGWLPHVKRPDLDKLVRGLWDPMKGIVWVDDSQVCFATIGKVYSWNDRPGAVVVIDFLSNEWAERYGSAQRFVSDVVDTL